jgi:hypothetical protein
MTGMAIGHSDCARISQSNCMGLPFCPSRTPFGEPRSTSNYWTSSFQISGTRSELLKKWNPSRRVPLYTLYAFIPSRHVTFVTLGVVRRRHFRRRTCNNHRKSTNGGTRLARGHPARPQAKALGSLEAPLDHLCDKPNFNRLTASWHENAPVQVLPSPSLNTRMSSLLQLGLQRPRATRMLAATRPFTIGRIVH